MLTEVLVSSDDATSFSESLGHLLAVGESRGEKPCGRERHIVQIPFYWLSHSHDIT